MKKRNINNELQSNVRRYVEYLFEEEKNGYQKGNKLYLNLSNDLKEDLWNDSYFHHIQNIPIFSKKFSKEFLKKATSIIEEKNFGPGEIIYKVDKF